MFDSLSDKLQSALGDLRKKGALDEEAISRAMREIRLALLEADVNFTVVRDFVARVRERALGEAVLKSLTPGQQVVKIVHDELTELMGEGESGLAFGKFTVILLARPPGLGQDDDRGEARLHLRGQGRKPGLIAADLQRPAAIDQLEQLGAQIQRPRLPHRHEGRGRGDAQPASQRARDAGLDTVIVDTAGRLQIDDELMAELERVRDEAKPHNVLLVLDAMTGQEAVNVARGIPGAHRVRRRDPDEARRRRPRRRRAQRQGDHREADQVRVDRARSSTRSRSSTPTGWRRASSAWATC